MLTVSLHKIKIHAPIGLYAEEKVTGNTFEIDVDLFLPDKQPWPFADYSLIHGIVAGIFQPPGELIETFVQHIYDALAKEFTIAEKIKVTIRKLNPPMSGEVGYSQVSYEK
jgi:dihydroneopterin aldolase